MGPRRSDVDVPVRHGGRSSAFAGHIKWAVFEKPVGSGLLMVLDMENVTSADGTTIAFDQLGTGPPLILVSGASVDRSIDGPLAAALAAHFTVLNYDRRGRGDSDDTLPFSLEREVEDLDVLLAAAGGSATVLGLSSGAALAAEAALRGLPIETLVMWEPPFSVDPEGRRRFEEYAEHLHAALADGRRGDRWLTSCGSSDYRRT